MGQVLEMGLSRSRTNISRTTFEKLKAWRKQLDQAQCRIDLAQKEQDRLESQYRIALEKLDERVQAGAIIEDE